MSSGPCPPATLPRTRRAVNIYADTPTFLRPAWPGNNNTAPNLHPMIAVTGSGFVGPPPLAPSHEPHPSRHNPPKQPHTHARTSRGTARTSHPAPAPVAHSDKTPCAKSCSRQKSKNSPIILILILTSPVVTCTRCDVHAEILKMLAKSKNRSKNCRGRILRRLDTPFLISP